MLHVEIAEVVVDNGLHTTVDSIKEVPHSLVYFNFCLTTKIGYD